MTAIAITVKLFAAYQDAYGVPELALELPAESTVATVRDRLLSEHPELEQWRDITRFAICRTGHPTPKWRRSGFNSSREWWMREARLSLDHF